MIRTQIYLPDDLYKDLKFLAAISGKKFSDLVREGARIVVSKRKNKGKKDPWKSFIGMIKGGPKDLSSNLDYYLYIEPYEAKKKKSK